MPLPPYLTRPLSWLRTGYPPGTANGYVPLIASCPARPRSPAAFPMPVNSRPFQLPRPSKTTAPL